MALRKPVSAEDHMQGNPDAPVVLLEYGDYQCPHCGRAYPIVKKLQQQLGDQLALAFRNFPLENIHPQAKIAAIAAEAAGLQGKYWEMHDILFENQRNFSIGAILKYAESIGLDMKQFEKDIADPALGEKVEKDFYNGMRSGVNGTPSFFINGEKFEGDWEGDGLLQYIREKMS